MKGYKHGDITVQFKSVVEVFYKPTQSDLWKITRYERIDETIMIESLDFKIKMGDLYFDLENLNK